QLYEGIELGKEGAIGLITYMRTDSPKVSNQAINSIRDYILKTYGKEYLPESPNIYKSKKQAQEAHEAIRPTIISNTPEKIKQYLNEDQYFLYELIYKKFVASQMNPAIYLQTSIDILAEKYLFIANGSRMIFKGFSIVYEDITQEREDRELPELIKDELLNLIKLSPSQHFTKPPPRFSESSLVKALEEEGIGRPSTYAPIIYTLVQRDYVRRIKGYFNPTELGMKVSDILVEYFPKIMDINFTALMEEELDEIEDGKLIWTQVVSDFYKPFSESLEIAKTQIKKEIIPTDEVCELCGKPMVIKWGRRGKFLSCSDFPKCKFAKSINTGIKCPEAGCSGFLIQRRSKRGIFYGCTRYPDCKYITKRLPQSQ
ncbi:MAG: DNA topoisomerase, partial [Candidatus Omnitrophota bacterium]